MPAASAVVVSIEAIVWPDRPGFADAALSLVRHTRARVWLHLAVAR